MTVSLLRAFCTSCLDWPLLEVLSSNWVLIHSYPDSNWCTDPDPNKLAGELSPHWLRGISLPTQHILLYQISLTLSSLFFGVLWSSLRFLEKQFIINPNIVSIPRWNANVKSFLWYDYCNCRNHSIFDGMVFAFLWDSLRFSEVSGKISGNFWEKTCGMEDFVHKSLRFIWVFKYYLRKSHMVRLLVPWGETSD